MLNGQRLPYPSLEGQVSVRWVAEHAVRAYGNGRKEVVGEAVYRPFFDLSYSYLEHLVQYDVWEELKATGQTTFAPYSIEGAPHPEAFDVLPPPEIPDTADLVLARFPFGLSLEGTRTWAKSAIPHTGPQPPIPCPSGEVTGTVGVHVQAYALGLAGGLVTLDWFAGAAPDSFSLIYEGVTVAEVEDVSGEGELTWYYPGGGCCRSRTLTVRVLGSSTGDWTYSLGCPDTSVPDPGGGGGPCVPPDDPANLAGETDGEDATWTWDEVEGADGYVLQWGTVMGGPYPNAVIIPIADLADPDAPSWVIEGAGGIVTYAVVSTYLTL